MIDYVNIKYITRKKALMLFHFDSKCITFNSILSFFFDFFAPSGSAFPII
jgi:hypothetical protein